MSKLLQDAPGTKMLLMGNEAVVRGAFEAGLNYACSYPGTPSSEVSTLLFDLQFDAPFSMEFGTNEKVAMEAVAGAALGGFNTLTAMKHVGMNVASDPLGTLAYLRLRGSLVIYNADDPNMFSSQNEQDNRHYSRLFGVPMFEPSTAQDMKDMTVAAFALSRELGMPVIVRSTTRVAHSRGVVEIGPVSAPPAPQPMLRSPHELVCLPVNAVRMHKTLLERLEKARLYSNSTPFNHISGPADAKWGVVTNSISAAYVADALSDLDLNGKVAVFRVGFSYPEPDEALAAFMQNKEKLLVVEELEPILETFLKALAQEKGFSPLIRGKGIGGLSRLLEYNAEMVKAAAAEFFNVPYTLPLKLDLQDKPALPNRPPNLCAGCPHRMSFYGAKKACAGQDVIFPNDIGCYTLGYGPPMHMADTVLCMGASASLPCGLSKAIEGTGQKLLSFIGDSTFFHSGMTGIANAVYNGHNFTLVILDNSVTAMTGHQPSPAINPEEDSRAAAAGLTPIDAEAVVKALGVKHVQLVRPANLARMEAAVREALDYNGLSVIIAREPCPLHQKRKHGKQGKLVFAIDQTKCDQCRICIKDYGCPAFQPIGDTVTIDATQCTGCAVCTQVCPQRAIKPLRE